MRGAERAMKVVSHYACLPQALTESDAARQPWCGSQRDDWQSE